jgi:hypothetical protein
VLFVPDIGADDAQTSIDGKQKTRRGGFLQDHYDILSVASEAMVDHP